MDTAWNDLYSRGMPVAVQDRRLGQQSLVRKATVLVKFAIHDAKMLFFLAFACSVGDNQVVREWIQTERGTVAGRMISEMRDEKAAR